jgi:mannose-6-phosphate isomerase
MSAEIYPFLMVPQFHARVWGTRDLRPYFTRPIEADAEPIGEVWLTGEECRAGGGPLAGMTLRELAAEHGSSLTGDASPDPRRFPLLIKFLFPRQKLSVQVHPDDEAARRAGEPSGKSECWYVARAIEGAQVGIGLRTGITREMFRMAIEASQAEHMLNWLDVHAGEMIYVDAGTVHAIGANSILVETQQNSDVTYRLYDYGRPRQLHVEEGLAVLREKTRAGRVEPKKMGDCQLLLDSPYFAVERYCLERPVTLPANKKSVQVLVCLDGGAIVSCPGAPPLSLMRGEAAVVPASAPPATLRPHWQAELLRMRLSSKAGPNR